MSITLEQFLDGLDQSRNRIWLNELKERLQQLQLTVDDVSDHVRFDDAGYQRNLIRRGPAYEALLLCWRPGQQSPIHDHRGSGCGVLVVSGVATETKFVVPATGPLVMTDSGECRAGQICGSSDMDTHRIANLHPTEDLITLHVYSPPLEAVGSYDDATGAVTSVCNSTNTGSAENQQPRSAAG